MPEPAYDPMQEPAKRICSSCGRKSPSSILAKRCPYCLLQLGLDTAASKGATSRLSGQRPTSFDSVPRLSLDPFVRDGVFPIFGDYELVEEIARGGMGIVYRAWQRSLNRVVAVKMILAGQLATVESLQRFKLEAEAAAKLHHPGIVPIYEIGEHDTQHFFSMEFIDGPSLADCLTEFSVDPLAAPATRREQERCIAELLERVARALQFAHQHGVLHRDLKPSNILIDQQGLPHLTDFGLAKLTGHEASGLTLTHAVLVTPGYLSPEQAAGNLDVTAATDTYGLGATLYELLTGRPPFVGVSAMDTMLKAIGEDPLPPRKLNPAISRDLETIALRCLEKEPAKRYLSAAAVADELQRFLRHEPIIARPITGSERLARWCRRKPALASLAAALTLTLIGGLVTTFWQWGRAEYANVRLSQSVEHLEWAAVDDMLQTQQASRALAKVAGLLREKPNDWKAAMFGMSIMEHNRFPIPIAATMRHTAGAELTVGRLSPDGQRVVTASRDGTARLWHALTGELSAAPLAHDGAVHWAEFSPDSRRIATSSSDKTVRLWDVLTGQPIGQPLVHEEEVLRVHFSSDGRWMLSRTPHLVTVFNAENMQLEQGPVRHEGQVIAARFVDEDKQIFVAEQNGARSQVRAWKRDTGQVSLQLATGHFSDADLTSDLSRAVTVNGLDAILWKASSGDKLRHIISPNGIFTKVHFSPSGNSFAAIGINHWARVWDSESGLPLTGELNHYYLLRGQSFLGSGDRLITWADDARTQVWDIDQNCPYSESMRSANRVVHAEVGTIEGAEIFLTVHAHAKAPEAGAGSGMAQLWRIHGKRKPALRDVHRETTGHDGSSLSPDGKWLALGFTRQEVWVMTTETGEIVCGPLPVKGGPWGVLFSPDGKRLVTATSQGQVAIWSLPSGKLLHKPIELKTAIQPVAMTRDGTRFATGSTDGYARIWDTDSCQIVREMQHGSEINSICFSPDGRWLASAGEDRRVCLWNAQSGERMRELKGHENEVMRVAYDPTGQRLVTASLDFTARIWDAERGESMSVLKHQGEVIDAEFSPDGRLVATASRDRTAVLWDATSGLPHTRAFLHEQAVRNVRFSPDGQRLMTLDFRGPRLWDVVSGHPLSVHLPQQSIGGTGFQNPSCHQFTPDGQSISIAYDCPLSLLWHLPVPPPTIPSWFPEFLEAVAGVRYAVSTDIPELVPPERFLAIRRQIESLGDSEYYARWAKSWLSEAAFTESALFPRIERR